MSSGGVQPSHHWGASDLDHEHAKTAPNPGHPRLGDPAPSHRSSALVFDPQSRHRHGLRSGSSSSTTSVESMNNNPQNTTPPHTPAQTASPGATGATDQIGRLSLGHGTPEGNRQPHRGRGMLGASSAMSSKRSASSELPREPGRQSPRQCASSRQSPPARTSNKIRPQRPGCQDRHSTRRVESSHETGRQTDPYAKSHHHQDKAALPHYSVEPQGSRTTYSRKSLPSVYKPSTTPALSAHDVDAMSERRKGLIQLPANSRYSGLILQPDSSPISQDQLAAEVKGIYAGLVMVEAKCINIDAAQAADPKSRLGAEQWQALIALHRTLLYEHHDFLMATQHPSATQALRGLATKYSMPARMWKHGIHAFLEVLRHRRPDSQDYMLAFIYLAYQMMALLFETVPSFTDTWIECLGDLARYRMAIEEEKEAHATWGGVAARWYTMASDRHPAIGRLYHHLGILERPSLRKFCFYAKSLTCVIPFSNARDSLSTLCGPIVQDEQTIQSSRQSAEARIVTYHALVYTGRDQASIDAVGKDSRDLLQQQPAKLRDFGAFLAVTNAAALFELGSSTNTLWQLYTAAINQAMQNARPSTMVGTQDYNNMLSTIIPDTTHKPALVSTTSYLFDCFDFVVRGYGSKASLKDALSYVHVSLVWLHSLHALNTRLNNGRHTFDIPFDLTRVSWDALVSFLNTLALLESVNARMLECARQGVFLAPERKEDASPLSEDYTIRGLIWAQFYFCPGWFDGQSEDDGRAIETPAMAKARAQRVLWLGLFFAFHTEYIQYDVQRKVFCVSAARQPAPPTKSAHPAAIEPDDIAMEQVSEAVAVTPRSRSSAAHSSSESSEDGFQKIKKPKYTYANAAARSVERTTPPRRKKPAQDLDSFQVADENGTVWSDGRLGGS